MSEFMSLVMASVARRQPAVLRLLVESGCPVDVTNRFGQTALHLAAMFLRVESAEVGGMDSRFVPWMKW